MSLREEPLDWQLSNHESYQPVYHQGKIAGFLKAELADEVIKYLNDKEILKKALTRACIDIVKQNGGDMNTVKQLIRNYIKLSERPKYGTRAIALFLRERQAEVDLNDQEFMKFCNTFMLSPEQLQSIYAGEPIDDSLIAPLARILNISQTRVLEVRDGDDTQDE